MEKALVILGSWIVGPEDEDVPTDTFFTLVNPPPGCKTDRDEEDSFCCKDPSVFFWEVVTSECEGGDDCLGDDVTSLPCGPTFGLSCDTIAFI